MSLIFQALWETEDTLDADDIGVGGANLTATVSGDAVWEDGTGMDGGGCAWIPQGGAVQYDTGPNFNKAAGTVCFWFKPNQRQYTTAKEPGETFAYSTCKPWRENADGLSWPYTRLEMQLSSNGGQPQFQLMYDDDGGGESIDIGVVCIQCSWNKNEWVHVALGWDSTARRLYTCFNGLMINLKNGAFAETDAGDTFQLGDVAHGPSVQAWYDKFRIYNTMLTLDEVQAVYAADNPYGRISITGVSGYYDTNEHTGHILVKPTTSPIPTTTFDYEICAEGAETGTPDATDQPLTEIGNTGVLKGEFSYTPEAAGYHVAHLEVKAASVGAASKDAKIAFYVTDDVAATEAARTTFDAPIDDTTLDLTEIDIGGSLDGKGYDFYEDYQLPDDGVLGTKIFSYGECLRRIAAGDVESYIETENFYGVVGGGKYGASGILVALDNLEAGKVYLLRIRYPDNDERSMTGWLFYPYLPNHHHVMGACTGGFSPLSNGMIEQDYYFRALQDSTSDGLTEDEGVGFIWQTRRNGLAAAISSIRCYEIGVDSSRLPVMNVSTNRDMGFFAEDSAVGQQFIDYGNIFSYGWSVGSWKTWVNQMMDSLQFEGMNSFVWRESWYNGAFGQYPGVLTGQGRSMLNVNLMPFDPGGIAATMAAQRGLKMFPRLVQDVVAEDTYDQPTNGVHFNLTTLKASISAGDDTKVAVRIVPDADPHMTGGYDVPTSMMNGLTSWNDGWFVGRQVTQCWQPYYNYVLETALHHVDHSSVPGVMIDARGSCPLLFGSDKFGYDDHPWALFSIWLETEYPAIFAVLPEHDPDDADRFFERYLWWRDDEDNKEAFRVWKCDYIHTLLTNLLTDVQAVRSDFKLYLMVYMPYPQNWKDDQTGSGWAPNNLNTAQKQNDTFRDQGLDPELYADESDIVFVRMSRHNMYLQSWYPWTDPVLEDDTPSNWYMHWVPLQDFHIQLADDAGGDNVGLIYPANSENDPYYYLADEPDEDWEDLFPPFGGLAGGHDHRVGGSILKAGGAGLDVWARYLRYADTRMLLEGSLFYQALSHGRFVDIQKFANEFRAMPDEDFTDYTGKDLFPLVLRYLYSGGSSYVLAINMSEAAVSLSGQIGQTEISHDFAASEIKLWTVAEENAQLLHMKISGESEDYRLYLLEWYLWRRSQVDRMVLEDEPSAETAAVYATRISEMAALIAAGNWEVVQYQYLYWPGVQGAHYYDSELGADSNNDPVFDDLTDTMTVTTGSKVLRSFSATDADADSLIYEGYILPTGSGIDSSTGLFEWDVSTSQVGTHRFLIHATDELSGYTTLEVTATVALPTVSVSGTRGLVSWYPLDSSHKQGPTVYSDRWPGAHHATAYNAPALQADHRGASNSALGFVAGSLQYLEVAGADDHSFCTGAGDTELSFSAWIYVAGDNYVHIVSKGTLAVASEYAFYVGTDRKLNFQAFDISVPGSYIGQTSLEPLAVGWHHVVVTYDASSVSSGFKFYDNGGLIVSTAFENLVYVDMEPLGAAVKVGMFGTDYTTGAICQLRLFREKLDGASVKLLFDTD